MITEELLKTAKAYTYVMSNSAHQTIVDRAVRHGAKGVTKTQSFYWENI
jgi:hypothetical protein